GTVFEAEHQATGRRVALKLLSTRVQQSADSVERFLREARLAASLSHPRSTFVYGGR
ncbi:MAG: serine/threonine protein kinase, partial [Planctomycetia bacterium]|nr:serine/threonine protein kinase [Planctomycetia bacterium]